MDGWDTTLAQLWSQVTGPFTQRFAAAQPAPGVLDGGYLWGETTPDGRRPGTMHSLETNDALARRPDGRGDQAGYDEWGDGRYATVYRASRQSPYQYIPVGPGGQTILNDPLYRQPYPKTAD